jgi:branched-chain amino acid transport system substrate-binding protein
MRKQGPLHALHVLTLWLALALLSACGGAAQPVSTSGQQPIKVGVSLSLTGDSSADGQATEHGYQIWQDVVNAHGGLLGRRVQMVILDDGTKTDQAHTNYENLIGRDHVDFVVGPFNDPFTVTGAEVALRHHYAFVEGIGGAPDTFRHGLSNLFSVSLSATRYLSSFDQYLLSRPQQIRPRTVAYASGDDPFTQPQIDGARTELQGTFKTALSTVYPAETTDYTPIAQAIIASNPDVVVLGTIGLQDCAAFLQYFKQQHFNPQLIIATSGPDQGQQFVKAIGANATEGLLVPDGGWYPSVNSFQNGLFVQNYLARYGGAAADISTDSAEAFSTGQVLAQAIVQAKSLKNEAVMAILRTGTFRTVQGAARFASDVENTVMIPFLFQWQKGTLLPVYPADQAKANVEYPKPHWP